MARCGSDKTDQDLVRRVERLVPAAASRTRTALGATGRSRRALLEDVYSVADAVVVGDLLISLLRHADRVTWPASPSWST